MNKVYLNIGGSDREIKFGFNAISDLEMHLGKKIHDVLFRGNWGFSELRGLLWAGIKNGSKLTPEQTGALIEKYIEDGGKLEDIDAKVTEALVSSKVLGIAKAAEDEGESEEGK